MVRQGVGSTTVLMTVILDLSGAPTAEAVLGALREPATGFIRTAVRVQMALLLHSTDEEMRLGHVPLTRSRPGGTWNPAQVLVVSVPPHTPPSRPESSHA